MLTGHGGLESAKQSLKQGAYDYLTKPCDIDLLASKINSAFEAIHGKKEAEEKKAEGIMIPIEDYTTVDMEETVKEAIRKLKNPFRALLPAAVLWRPATDPFWCWIETGNWRELSAFWICWKPSGRPTFQRQNPQWPTACNIPPCFGRSFYPADTGIGKEKSN